LKALSFLLGLLFPVLLFPKLAAQDTATAGIDSLGQQPDSTLVTKDSSLLKDTVQIAGIKLLDDYNSIVERAVKQSRYLNATGTPAVAVSRERKLFFEDTLFYLVLAVVLFLAFLRFFFDRYFNNMFRVFFNTSLRQSQLTDQLLQAKQVSLFFNLLFAVTGGLYIYFLLQHFNWINASGPLVAVAACSLAVALIYFLKFITLKFTGWLTGYNDAANTYLFIIFLINKILGILLLPFVIVMAFAEEFLRYPAVLISLLLVALMFLLRFLRSYGLLRRDIKVSRFHFFLYIAGIELVPLLLIYKALMVLLSKNL
jgi:hypothetical protein